MTAFVAVLFLSLPGARHAILTVARTDGASRTYLSHCRRLSRRAVRCTVVEERIAEGTETSPGVIEVMEGPLEAIREHGFIRVHDPAAALMPADPDSGKAAQTA